MAEIIIPLPDGGQVIMNDDRRNTIMNIANLYKYRFADQSSEVIQGEGQYVPNVDDMIYDWKLGQFRVSRVDKTNFVADLVLWELPKNPSDVGVEDVLLGVGPGYSSESYRMYVDTRVFPYRLDINSRLHAYGSRNTHMRVFRGVNITESGEVVSAMYNQGDYVGDSIPLELVEVDEVNNLANKAPIMGYTTKDFVNGELVTAVTYNDAGSVTGIAKLLVHITNVVRHPDDGMKRVQSIELVSRFLSASEPNVLEVPINALVSDLVLRAKVTYTNGESRLLDVVDEDANGKFKVMGLKFWSPTIGGHHQPIDLVYQLDPDEEYSYLQGETFNGAVVEPYKIKAMPVDPAFSLKLYVFPTWVSPITGYVLDYWLYDLKREIARRVPRGAVELSETSPSFNGLDYTSTQYLQLQVNLAAVDVEYGAHTHVQSVQIALLRDGTNPGSNWKVKFSGNQPVWYGDGLKAPCQSTGGGTYRVNLTNGEGNKTAWLERMYYASNPLYDQHDELRAPEPTHFILVTKTREFEVPVAQWMNDITFINDLAAGETLYIRWIRRLAQVDLQLGVTGLPVQLI